MGFLFNFVIFFNVFIDVKLDDIFFLVFMVFIICGFFFCVDFIVILFFEFDFLELIF